MRRYNPVDLRNIAIHHKVNVRKNAKHENVIKAVMNHEKLNNLRLDGDRFVDVIPSSSQSAEQINKDDYDDFSKEKDDYDDDDDDDDDADDTIAVVEQNLDVPVGELAVAENNTDVAAAMGEHTVSWSGSFNAAKNQPLPESDDELGAGLVVRRRKQMMHGKGLVSGGGLGDFLSGLASKAIDFVKKDPIGALKKAVSIGQDAFKYGKEAHGVYKKYFSGKEKGGMLKGCTEKFKKKYIHHAYKLHKFISKA